MREEERDTGNKKHTTKCLAESKIGKIYDVYCVVSKYEWKNNHIIRLKRIIKMLEKHYSIIFGRYRYRTQTLKRERANREGNEL